MEMQATLQSSIYEQTLLNIVRTLPTERMAQLLDYARYVKSLTLRELAIRDDETEANILAGEARWDKQFAATEDGMESMADSVRASIRAGQSTPMVFTAEGMIAPK